MTEKKSKKQEEQKKKILFGILLILFAPIFPLPTLAVRLGGLASILDAFGIRISKLDYKIEQLLSPPPPKKRKGIKHYAYWFAKYMIYGILLGISWMIFYEAGSKHTFEYSGMRPIGYMIFILLIVLLLVYILEKSKFGW